MTSLKVFTVIQFIIIILGTIICVVTTQKNKDHEKKYILPYCLANFFAMIILAAVEFIKIPLIITESTMYIFACCEIFLLPNYIATVIGEKNNYFIQIIICIGTYILSRLLINNYTSILYLISNVYITIYVCKYFIWLFKIKEVINLKNASHYWIVMGICVCYTGSIPYWISEIIILKIKGYQYYSELANVTFNIYIILNIFMYILFSKALLCTTKQQKYYYGL